MMKIVPAARPMMGVVRVPGDKSIAHRCLILGAMSDGGLSLAGLPDGEDVRSTRRCLEALGTSITRENGAMIVKGNAARTWRSPRSALDCGNSGTTMRLMMGALSGARINATLTGDASLSRRPMARVAEPLRLMGAEISLADGKFAPVGVRGHGPLKAACYRLPVPSAQVKSAILLAGLSARGETIVSDPFASRDHTERLLAWLNPSVLQRQGHDIHLRPGNLPGGGSVRVPGDISSAAFFIAAAVLIEGSRLALPGVGINPTRMGFIEVLREMGGRIEVSNAREEAGEPVADITASHSTLRGVMIASGRVSSLIDEVPLLAVMAAAADGTTRIEGLGELRLKESDRLAGTARALSAMGADVRVDGDALELTGPSRLKGASIDTLGDHRLAMAFAIAGKAASGETLLSDERCAAISYPRFFRDLGIL